MSHIYAALKSTAYDKDGQPIPVTRLIRVHKNKYSATYCNIMADRARQEASKHLIVEEKKPYIL